MHTEKIKIGFDARMINHSGIGSYIRGILKFLIDKKEFDFTIFGDHVKTSNYTAKKVLLDFPIYSIREQLFFPGILKEHEVDLLHVPHYNAPIGYKKDVIVTIHDLIHLIYPPSRFAYFYARTMMEAVCSRSKTIITDSEHTKKDLMDMLGVTDKKIRVVYPAVSNEFFPRPASQKLQSEPPYLLYVGNIKPTKNIKTLINAFLEAKRKIKDLRLILVGKNFMKDYTKSLSDHSDIKFIGEIAHNDLIELYCHAKLFVFPSLYEGFGLPPLEAMACGTPVLCSNAASLPEVVGDSAVLFDPKNTAQLAGLIVQLWDDSARRQELSAKGLIQSKKFSWETAANQIAEVYLENS